MACLEGRQGAMTQRERSRKAQQRWQGLLAEQGRSGESVAAFCRERQLCASHFYWWKKRLGARGAAGAISADCYACAMDAWRQRERSTARLRAL